MNVKLSFAASLKALGLPLVKINVNGHEGFFLVETCSYYNSINPEFATLVGAEEILYTGNVSRKKDKVEYYETSFKFDGVETDVFRFSNMGLYYDFIENMMDPKGFCLDGIIGEPVLQALKATIDFNRKVLTLRIPEKKNEKE